MCDLDHAAICRLWAAMMRQWMVDARESQAERFYLAAFLELDERQMHRLLRANTSRFRRLER